MENIINLKKTERLKRNGFFFLLESASMLGFKVLLVGKGNIFLNGISALPLLFLCTVGHTVILNYIHPFL